LAQIVVKTMKITDSTHRELTRVSAILTAKDGRRRTFDETILELIEIYRAKEKPIGAATD
jgi:hypothetical protein